MNTRRRRDSRSLRPREERLESRLVMSSHTSVPAEVRAILAAAGGVSPVRPNTPVLPLETTGPTITFVDPTVHIVAGQRQRIGSRDYIAPNVTLDATNGVIVIGSSSTIQDDARLIANPGPRSGTTEITVGDNVAIGDDAIIRGPATIGAKGGAVTSIGAGALIDGATIAPGAFVGTLARVGPGVTVPAGYRVLPGANVSTNLEAKTPSLGYVVKVTAADTATATATKLIAQSSSLAVGYAALFEGSSATGGAASAGPIAAAISASGSTVFFGALNTVLGASAEPGSARGAAFEPASGSPTFLALDGTQQAVPLNRSYAFKARVIGNVSVLHQGADAFQAALGGVAKIGLDQGPTLTTNGDTIRADEGQPFAIGSIASLGKNVSIHSPGGGVQGSTTTTTVTSTTVTATRVTTTTTVASTSTSSGAPTATPGTTTLTTTGVNAQGQATTGTITTTIAVKSTNLGSVTIGRSFSAGDSAVILGNPNAATTIGDGVTVGAGAVVSGSTIGSGAQIGARASIANSTIPAGAVIPAGAIILNNVVVGTVQW